MSSAKILPRFVWVNTKDKDECPSQLQAWRVRDWGREEQTDMDGELAVL